MPLADEAATIALGNALAASLKPPAVMYLEGDLGAGKTTLARGLLRGLGHVGSVKSPTYTLVEPYELEQFPVYHCDLYRLGDPEELEYLGMRDYSSREGVLVIEWPERGAHRLPAADIRVCLRPSGEGRVADIEIYDASVSLMLGQAAV